MRNAMKILVAGTLVVCLSVGLVYADGAVAPTTLDVKALQKTMLPGGTGTFEIYLKNVSDLGAFQVKMKLDGGTTGSIKVTNLVIEKNRSDFVFGSAEVLSAVDQSGWRAGGVRMTGGQNIVEPAIVATVTVQASRDAKGTFLVGLDKGEDHTFLRNSNAVAIPFVFGESATVNILNSEVPSSRDKRKRTSNR